MRNDRVRFLFIIFILYSVIRPMICIDGNKPKVLDQFLSGLLIDENSIKDKQFSGRQLFHSAVFHEETS